jgi:hypothetical protein
MNQNPREPSQRIDIDDSVIEGQVGQAGRDLRQFQFILGKRKSKTLDPRDRQVLLDRVSNFWIKGALEELSRDRPLIEPELRECLDLVEQLWGMVYETPNQLRHVLPSGTRIIELFDELGEGGTLLLLGESNSGKTRILLEIARDLIGRANSNLESPVPVIFNLSSWKGGNQAIVDWIIQGLQEKYRISKAASQMFVENECLLLLLDGLDKVQAERRALCVQALNQFVKKHGKSEIIVCSRIKEYEVLSRRLRFQRAICIKPKTL